MLKHKIRKSRKNILSLLESVQVEEDKHCGEYTKVPVFMAWQPPRRSSPQEDFIFTLTGVRNLIHQQSLLLTELQSNLYTTTGAHTKDDTMDDVNTEEELSPATAKDASSGNLSKSSSSMKALRRIMEIEELVTFSQALERRLARSDKNKC